MEGVVQCPVCTLFLHPGMDLAEHLETHPKDQVIQALSQLTLQRANILSPQFVAKPAPTVAALTAPAATTTTTSPIIATPGPSSAVSVKPSPLPPPPPPAIAQQPETALGIQVPQPNPIATPQSQMFNKQSSISYVHDPQKNVTIVNSCSTQFIQQRIPTARKSLEIYEPPIQIVPRYTSERYSGPPPPYSTAISTSNINALTTIARDSTTLVCSSNENSSSSYEVKSHFAKSFEEEQYKEEEEEDEDEEEEEPTVFVPEEDDIVMVVKDEDDDEEVLPEATPMKNAPVQVLSNVKISSGMLDIQEILLKTGRKTSKISNKKPAEDDPATPEAHQQLEDEVMDLTTPSAFDAPSTSQQHHVPEPPEDVAKFEEVPAEEERAITATPTSVIRTIGCNSPKPSTSAVEPPAPPPPPQLKATRLVTPIGRPIVSKPKKLTLKLKKTIDVVIKQEPNTTLNEEKTDEEVVMVPSIIPVKCEIRTDEPESETILEPDTTEEDAKPDPEALYTDPNTASSYIITYVNDGEPKDQESEQPEEDSKEASELEKVQYPTMVLREEVLQEEVIPMAWVQRFSPNYAPFDERSSYMDLDGFSKNSNSASVQSTSNSYDRAPSTESLNIRTDEKMPAKGEISEQESNGEVDHWNQIYNDGVAQYPTSYDVSLAQECWNLSSQNKLEIPQFGSFPSLPLEENARETTPDSFIPKEEKDFDVILEKHDTTKPKKVRSYRCHDCIKSFPSLKERRLHQAAEHPVSNEPSCSGAPNSVPSVDVAGSSRTYCNQFGGLSTMLSEGLGQIVENFQIVKQEISSTSSQQTIPGATTQTQIADIKAWIVQPSLITEEQFLAIRSESKKMLMLYKCDTCRDEFKNLKTFNKHFSVHPAECSLCGRGFTRWATFTLHLKRHFNIRDYECRLCNKSFILRQKLVEHMRIHTGNAPIQCNVCFARFRRYSNLAQHRNRHHLNKRPYKKDYVCECGETFVSQAKLNWHRETHDIKPKVCAYCRERFIHLNSLTRHIRLSHPDKYSIMKNKTVQCPFCDQKYLQTSLKAHLETHSKTKNQYSCQICNKEFSTKWNLKQHQWTHANRSTKPFQCNVCPNAFVRENDYTTHMNAHKAIRPYTCNHCGCQFVRKSNWMRHTREHEQEKSYTCDVCNKRFHRAYYLTEHRRVHTGERPFTCTICGKKSATKTNHNKHIKIHHARDPLTAEG